jgi:hypothetical protein
VAARDGIVKGWCPTAKKEIKVSVNQEMPEQEIPGHKPKVEVSYLEELKQKREKVLKDVVSAREDGDLKENSAYHAAREQLSILDDKILREQERIKQSRQK